MPNRSLQVTRVIQKRRVKTKHDQHSLVSSGLNLFLIFSSLLAAGVALLMVFGGIILGNASRNLPAISELPLMLDPVSGSLLQPTRILDRTARIEIDQLDVASLSRKFLFVSQDAPQHFSPVYIQSVIQSFQPDFWSNPGVRIDHLTRPDPSTLAEQLVHDLLLWSEPEGASKTIRMHVLAVQAVTVYGREKILEWYLNSLYFGHNILGAEEASQAFLGKSASMLDLAESTLLIAVAGSPALNPWDAPEQAKLLQERLLTRLFVEGKLTQAEYLHAKQQTLAFQKAPDPEPTIYSGFTRLLFSQLDGVFPDYRLERGGLAIVSTLDVNLQELSTCTLQTRLAQLEMRPTDFSLPGNKTCQADRWLSTLDPSHSSLPGNLAGSIVMVDPETGQLLALVADESLMTIRDNLQSHSPGSTLTPFIALGAFSRGFSPASLLWDIPSSTSEGVISAQGSQGSYHGPIRFRTALGKDILRPITDVQEQVGAEIIWKLAEPFGIPDFSQSSSSPEFLYSGGSLSPLKLAQAYSVFANLGSMTGWRISENPGLSTVCAINILNAEGEPFWSPPVETQPVLSSQLAYLVHDVLSSSMGWRSAEWQQITPSIDRPAGVKLGGTSDGQNAWAIGYTPQRLTVVWLGLPVPSGPVRLESQDAGDIWQAIMLQAHLDLPVLGWSIPGGLSKVTVCDPSGLLPTDACPQTVSEIFLSGTEPSQLDNLYQKIAVNRETGRLATVYTSPTLVEQKIYMNIPPEARSWASNAGIILPPAEYDQVPVIKANPLVEIEQPSPFSVISGKVQIRGTAGGESFLSAWVEVGQGINPTAWSKPGSTLTSPVSEAVLATWDTKGLAGLYAIQLIVLHQDKTFESAVIQVTIDNSVPLAASRFPQPNDLIPTAADGWVVFLATASDNIAIDRVEWWLDGVKAGIRYIQPFSLPVQISPGSHKLIVRVYDSAGNMSQTESIPFAISQ